MRTFLILTLLVASPLAAITPEESKALFEKLKTMDGDWSNKSTKGWEEVEHVQVIAGGSAIMATSFDAHPNEHMATMIHLDGDRLLLTHYCMAKNQPRLVATSYDGKSATFEFLDGTGMKSRDVGHMDKVVMKFIDDDHYTSQWTWYAKGAERWLEEIEHRRVRR